MNKNITILFFVLLICSCSTKKKIFYIQDASEDSTYETFFEDYLIKPDDILKIDIKVDVPVNSISPESENSFSKSRESMLLDGYMVDLNGYIDFPSIGKIQASGLSLSQLKTNLYEKFVSKKLYVNPTIDIKILNAHFTILGEVNKPGRYIFDENNLDILQAIGIAGDLTINGQRNDIKLIRNLDGDRHVKSIDLTEINFITSKNFQVFSGDIIVVNPNSSRVKNAGIIGNSGTLLSLLSFILSSIIVISSN